MAAEKPERWQERVRDPSLTVLLAFLLVWIFVVTPLIEVNAIMQEASILILILLGAFAVLTAASNRTAVILILAAMVAGLVTAIVNTRQPSALNAGLARGSAVGVLAVLAWHIGRAVFGPGRVTFHRIQGALAFYLILALIFTHVYGVITVLVPDAFSNLPSEPTRNALYLRGRLLYFSLVTLTSVGYGDVLPLHPFARSLDNLESLVGQLFPPTLLARLITLELEGRRR